MKALITGASSGIGREIAVILDNMGYDIIAVARRNDKLLDLKSALNNNTQIHVGDISDRNECLNIVSLFPDIDILVNNAGIGVFGEFTKTDYKMDMSMIDLNVCSSYILMKLYLNKFVKRNKGYILNVSSSAAFFSGPLFSAYYASKAYIYRLTRGVAYELKKKKSKVSVSVLCPGPVDTEFNMRAGVKPGVGAYSPEYVAKYAVKKMFRKKLVIIPGIVTKFTVVFAKLLPECLGEKIVYNLQKKKSKK